MPFGNPLFRKTPGIVKLNVQNKLSFLVREWMPNPPFIQTARFLNIEHVPEALNSMQDSIRVKQENECVFFAHLFLFILFDQQMDTSLHNSKHLVDLTEETLKIHENKVDGQNVSSLTQQEYKPKYLHQAVRTLAEFSQEQQNANLAQFIQEYKENAKLETLDKCTPILNAVKYMNIRNKILNKTMDALIQIGDKEFIKFLIEFEDQYMDVTPEVVRALYQQNFFDALWRYSRCHRLFEAGYHVPQRDIANFHRRERQRLPLFSVSQCYTPHEVIENPKFKNYLAVLFEARRHCMYLRSTYQIKTDHCSSADSGRKQNTLSSTRNNLRRSHNESQIREVPRNLSLKKKLPDPVMEQQEEKNDFEKQVFTDESKEEDSSSIRDLSFLDIEEGTGQLPVILKFEFSMVAQFIHFLLSIEKVRECEPIVSQSKIVSFLIHTRMFYGFEDQSVLRMLLLFGYENQALYLISTQNYAVSPELFVTAIHCEAYIVALFLEGGNKYLKACEENNKVFQHKKKDQFHNYSFQHPTEGYYFQMDHVASQFNQVMLQKLKMRPQYLEILLFLWKRHLDQLDYDTGILILEEIRAQLDFSVTNFNADGGYLRFVCNPLKICVLQIEFLTLIHKQFPQLKSKAINVITTLLDVAKSFEEYMDDSSGINEDGMRYILEDHDLESRPLLNIISSNEKLIDLLDHPIIERKSVEKWEGPFRVNKSFIPTGSLNSELMDRFFNDKIGENIPLPIVWRCKSGRSCCTRRQIQSSKHLFKQAESLSEIELSHYVEDEPEPRAQIKRSKCYRFQNPQFQFGFECTNKLVSKLSRPVEQCSLYQFQSWRQGQQLRYYESYVFELLILVVLHAFLFIVQKHYHSIASFSPAQITSNEVLQEYMENLISLDQATLNSIHLVLIFLFIPLHYFLLSIYHRLTGLSEDGLISITSFLDLAMFVIVLYGSIFVFPDYYSLSEKNQALQPSNVPSLNALELIQLKEYLTSLRTDLDNSNVWLLLAIMAFITQMQVGFALRVSRTLGPLYKVLMLNCKDFFIWLSMFLITLAMFAVIGVLVGVESIRHPCRTYKDCIIMFFQASMGEMSFAEQVNLNTSEFILVLCIIINMVLLLSILIAMLTKTYDKINDRAKLYYMKEVFNLVESRKVDSKYGAFVSLDFPLTIFPGFIILILLYCCNRRASAETIPELRRRKFKQAEEMNKCAMRFPAYTVSWIILSLAIIFVNLIVSPLVWLLIVYNEAKIFQDTPNLKIEDNQSEDCQHLSPQLIAHVPRGPDRSMAKKSISRMRSKRFFAFSIWIVLFGFPLVLLHTLYHVALFCANLCRSQKSIIKREGSKDLKNFQRHQMTYQLILEPQPVATLATLAYEELSSNYNKLNQKRPLHVITEEEVISRRNTPQTYTIKVAHSKTKATIDFSEKRMKMLVDQGLGKMDWQDSKKTLDENPNTIMAKHFYRKFRRELKNKERRRIQMKESQNLIPTISKQRSSDAKDQFYIRSVSAVPREAQNEAADTLKQKEVFKRLLMHFSVRKSVIEDIEENLQSLSILPLQTSNTLATEQSTNEGDPKLVSQHFLYLDSFVGIYSTMLVYSKLEKFSRHPSQIPPSILTNFADLLAREEYYESLHSGKDIECSPQGANRKFIDMSGLSQSNLFNSDTQQYNLLKPKTHDKMKRLPSALRFEESSYIKKYQIESLFYIFNLKRLNGALRGLNSKMYRRVDPKGEIGKCAQDIKELKLKEKLKQQALARRLKEIQTSKFNFEKNLKKQTIRSFTPKSMFRGKTKVNKIELPPVIGESQLEEEMPTLQTEKLSDHIKNLFPPTERELEVIATDESQEHEEQKQATAVQEVEEKDKEEETKGEEKKLKKDSSEKVLNVHDDDLLMAVPSPFDTVLQQRPFTAGEVLSQTERIGNRGLSRTKNELALPKFEERKDSLQDRKEAWGAMFEIGESDEERQNTVQSDFKIFEDEQQPPPRNSID